MNITLKLFADLTEYLPAEAAGNAVEIHTDAPLSAAAVLAKYNLPPEAIRVVMRNGEFLPPEERDRPLADGDVLSVWPSIQGG